MTREKKSKRSTMTLSVTSEDKRAFKLMALNKEMSASALLHEWIERESKRGKK